MGMVFNWNLLKCGLSYGPGFSPAIVHVRLHVLYPMHLMLMTTGISPIDSHYGADYVQWPIVSHWKSQMTFVSDSKTFRKCIKRCFADIYKGF